MSQLHWTHPSHKSVAALGTVANAIALMLCIESIIVTVWFSSGVDNRNGKYFLPEMNVDCTLDICFKNKDLHIAVWQKVANNLFAAGLVSNSVTLCLLLVTFWPLALYKNKVLNPVMTTCYYLDFGGAFCKFVGSFIYIFHGRGISKSYAWDKSPFVLKLEWLPLCLMLFSFLWEMISVIALVVATDRGPRTGGKTHIQRLSTGSTEQAGEHYGTVDFKLHIKAKTPSIPDAVAQASKSSTGLEDSAVDLRVIGSFPEEGIANEPSIHGLLHKKVSYMPDAKESHQRHLSLIQISKNAFPSEGTDV